MAHPSLLYDEMSGMENLRYFARLYDIAGDGRCEQVIRAVGLDPELSRPVGKYSQGMRQRMSLARAILHDPKILLLDEPFSNVDVHSAREMVGLLKGMRDAGKTIFVVTHQAALLEGVADEFVWMQAGQIVDRTHHLARDLNQGDRTERGNHEVVLVDHARHAGQRYPPGVALQRCAQRHAVLLSAGGRDLHVFLRSSGGGIAPHCRRPGLGGVFVCAVVALNQTWARELRNQVLDAYRVSPAPATALFLAKVLGNFIFVSLLEALMAPLFVIFYNLRVLGPAWQLIPVALLGTWALVVNGTFFAAMSIRTRSRELMLPLLLFPVSIPAVVGMVAAPPAFLPETIPRTSTSYCFSPTMWCLLQLDLACLKRCCKRNELKE